MQSRKQDLVLVFASQPLFERDNIHSMGSSLLRFYMNQFIIEEDTQTEIVAVHHVGREIVEYAYFKIRRVHKI